MEYGIKTVPDGVTPGPAAGDRMAETVSMSIAEALAVMHGRQAGALGLGSDIGQVIEVPGPVSTGGNEPVLDSDGDYDYDKSPDTVYENAVEDTGDDATAVIQNGETG